MIDSSGPLEAADLAKFLRTARIEAGRTQREAAGALGASLAKIIRLEGGKVKRITPLDAYTLLRFYDYPRPEASRISGHEVFSHPPLEAFDAGIPPWLRPFLEYEGQATLIQQYQRDMLPGLLRSPDHAVPLQAYQPPGVLRIPELEVELQNRRVQRFLAGSTRMHAIVEESVLYRQMATAGSEARAHLSHILAMSSHERVRLQVLPIAAGLVAGMSSTFAVFTMPDGHLPIGTVAVSQTPGTAVYMALDHAYAMYTGLFADLAGASLSPAESADLIDDLRTRMS